MQNEDFWRDLCLQQYKVFQSTKTTWESTYITHNLFDRWWGNVPLLDDYPPPKNNAIIGLPILFICSYVVLCHIFFLLSHWSIESEGYPSTCSSFVRFKGTRTIQKCMPADSGVHFVAFWILTPKWSLLPRHDCRILWIQ